MFLLFYYDFASGTIFHANNVHTMLRYAYLFTINGIIAFTILTDIQLLCLVLPTANIVTVSVFVFDISLLYNSLLFILRFARFALFLHYEAKN